MTFLQTFNKKLSTVFNGVMATVLVAIPVGLVYQSYKSYQFMQNCHDSSCGTNIGILYFILIPAEFYLIVIYVWLRAVQRSTSVENIKLVQLILIFILGVVPGILLLYPAFLKD